MTTYILKLEDSKYLKKLINNRIYFLKIKYQNSSCLLYVDQNNYEKILKYQEIYPFVVIKIMGWKKYQLLFQKYYLFLFSILIGLAFLYLLSHMIFDVKIMTEKKDIIKVLEKELDYYHLTKYHFIKTFEEKEQIKKQILKEHQDKFEWLEIELVGGRYYIKVLERIINSPNEEKYQNVVAKKNAMILEIKAQSGQIIKKINDYVNKGDTIISGYITKKDEIKNTVMAKGSVYGETWYNVKVELPYIYEKKLFTGKSYQVFTLNLFNKKIFLFNRNNYLNYELEDKIILGNNLLPFSFNKTTVKEVEKVNSLYTYDEALNKGLDIARKKLIENLDKDSKILMQRKLKLYEENHQIIMEVFFKVYENITSYQEINVLSESETVKK